MFAKVDFEGLLAFGNAIPSVATRLVYTLTGDNAKHGLFPSGLT